MKKGNITDKEYLEAKAKMHKELATTLPSENKTVDVNEAPATK